MTEGNSRATHHASPAQSEVCENRDVRPPWNRAIALSQNERGVTIEISRGNRYATTLTKPRRSRRTRTRLRRRAHWGCRVSSRHLFSWFHGTGGRDAYDHGALARAVQFHEHHALPFAKRKLAPAHRDIYRSRRASPTKHAPTKAYATLIAMLANHVSLSCAGPPCSHVGIPVLGNDHGGSGMRDEQVAQPARCADFSKRMIYLFGDVGQLHACFRLYFEFDQFSIIFARRTGRWSNRKSP